MVDTTKPAIKMFYRYLGNSGLRVSVLSFGNLVTILQDDKQKFMTDSVRRCLEHGINYFDTAESYGYGEAETILVNSF